MNRQIKFRGKRKDTGEWVYGDLLHIDGGCLIYFGSQTEAETPYIEKSSPIAVELFKTEIAVVEPDSVGQFTGLCDKNGTPIYEGDIIRYIGNYDGDEFFRVVKYDVASFEPLYSSFIMTAYDEESWILEVIPRIIGNIHDNPDLMKGGEE